MADSSEDKAKPLFMISVVAEMLDIHPQTLRLYEREGLVVPQRTDGNTRLYSQEDIEKLRRILRLTRELGVNLAGVQVILGMREKMEQMQEAMEQLIQYVQMLQQHREQNETIQHSSNALVKVSEQGVIVKADID